jgi:hypothetical protein
VWRGPHDHIRETAGRGTAAGNETDHADEPDATVTSVDAQSRTMYVHVRAPGELPPVKSLLDRLEGRIPDGTPVVVDASRGRRIDAGEVGD